DQSVYERLFNLSNVCVLPSEDQEGRKSCHNVERIVSELYTEENNPKVLGIRDKDYTVFNTTYQKPNNIFLTDDRDLEMMLFKAPSVVTGLGMWHSDFSINVIESINICRYIGYLRIYNELNQCDCKFQRSLTKISLVWDYDTQAVIHDYKLNLFAKFQQSSKKPVTKEALQSFIAEINLENFSSYEICQGHDVCRLLRAMMKSPPYNEQKRLFDKMVNSYSQTDFHRTQLYDDIINWFHQRGIDKVI
ncbi:MAG: DUF4435 domain-containing protein, partial [Muribaculaceae bacterium]|nr:DUF4435 domain-containing protein [Muribaculaceae bacterium]